MLVNVIFQKKTYENAIFDNFFFTKLGVIRKSLKNGVATIEVSTWGWNIWEWLFEDAGLFGDGLLGMWHLGTKKHDEGEIIEEEWKIWDI